MQLRDRVMRRRRDRHTQPLVVVTKIIKVAGVTLTQMTNTKPSSVVGSLGIACRVEIRQCDYEAIC